MNADGYRENLIKISNGLDNCDAIQEEKKRRLQDCNEYYDCVSGNLPYLEKYHHFAAEVSNHFDRQEFDTFELSNSFVQIGVLDGKLAILQSKMSDIQRFLRSDAEHIIALPERCHNDLSFGEISDRITEIDAILYNLQREEAEAEERRRQRKENWKTAGKVIWTILKWILTIGGFIFIVFWTLVKAFMPGSRDDD